MVMLCEAAFGLVRGREIQQLVEDSTGEACPCKQGRPCPLGAKYAENDRVLIVAQR